MLLLARVFLIVLVCQEIVCFCEERHIIFCDNLGDIKNKSNDTTTWRHVQIGSDDMKSESNYNNLDKTIFFNLARTKYLTIIGQLKFIQGPFNLIYLSRLEYLNLYANDILSINHNSFKNFPKLKEIYLTHNNIEYLGDTIFRNTTLDIVNLSWNRIEDFSAAFHRSTIKWIMLNHNRIKELPYQGFPNSLEQLELNYNFLETIDLQDLTNLRNLKELYLEHNHLKRIPDIEPLRAIQYLHFAHNDIREVHYPFNKHKSLEFLDLSSNAITNVSVDALASNGTPPLAMLSFNRLTNIVFEHPGRRTDLVLYGNPWICDCLTQIEKTIQEHKHMKTCEVNYFDMGQIPFCIENGKCGTAVLLDRDIDRFKKMVTVCEEEIKKRCDFRL